MTNGTWLARALTRPRRIALLATASVALTGAMATQAQAFEIAAQDDGVFLSQRYYNRELGLSQTRALGVSYLRVNVIYSQWVRWGFAPYDDIVNRAAAHGMRVQFTLFGTPEYDAAGDKWLGYYRPSPSRFAAFVQVIAGHFRGRVFRYSLWNEPNMPYFLAPASQGPRLYRNLYKAGYRALKAVDRRNKALIGEMAPLRKPWTFIQRVAAHARLRADGIAYHPYQLERARPGRRDPRGTGISSTPDFQRVLRSLARKRWLRTPRGRAVPIYYTEFGYLRYGKHALSPSRTADWLVAAFRYAKRHGVRQLLYYQLVSPPVGSPFYNPEWDSSLINSNGSLTLPYRRLLGARATIVGR